jgi:hypothetical protein
VTHATVKVQTRTMERLAKLRERYEERGDLERARCPWSTRHAPWSAVILRAVDAELARIDGGRAVHRSTSHREPSHS